MAQQRQNYYTNPAFCQQSEYYNQPEYPTSSRTRALSPERRHPPIGAQKPNQVENYSSPPKVIPKPRTFPRKIVQKTYDDEQEFEEMLVDATTVSPQRKNIPEIDNYNADQTNGNRSYAYINGNDNNNLRQKTRYAEYTEEEYTEELPRPVKNRYEYIPMQEQGMKPQRIIQKAISNLEEVEISSGRVHRYAVIPADEEIPQKRYSKVPKHEVQPQRTNQGRYAEIPVQEEGVIMQTRNRYAVVSMHEDELQNNRYAVIPPERRYQVSKNRYEYIPDDPDNRIYQQEEVRKIPQNIKSPHTPRKGNPEATQKLHELLITPQKFQKIPITPQKLLSPQIKPKAHSSPMDPFRTPNKTPPKPPSRNHTPKAQQKLNYTLSTRQNLYDKRQNTAIIAPICSSPVQSVYSETTFSNKTESWMNLSMQKAPAQATLAIAAIMMMLCGGLSSGLCFYMVSVVGRMYYLDFGIVSGFACLLLGCLGFRARNCHWLPNRNYISGYIVLSVFSLLTCAGLLVLLFLQPKPGSPLADVTSGAVCGISGLSLMLASSGVIASYCCKYPPPDNRVQHCARGFSV